MTDDLLFSVLHMIFHILNALDLMLKNILKLYFSISIIRKCLLLFFIEIHFIMRVITHDSLQLVFIFILSTTITSAFNQNKRNDVKSKFMIWIEYIKHYNYEYFITISIKHFQFILFPFHVLKRSIAQRRLKGVSGWFS